MLTRCGAVFWLTVMPAVSVWAGAMGGGRDEGPAAPVPVRIELVEGSVLTGVSLEPSITLDTAYGRLTLPMDRIRRIQSLRIEAYLIRGRLEEDYTEFVKDAPADAVSGCERVTRSADTIDSVASRHRSAPWLYPIAGRNELPRVFVEDGRTWYPIWGTWRSNWSGQWCEFDESRNLLNPSKSTQYPHLETRVDYWVTPASRRPVTVAPQNPDQPIDELSINTERIGRIDSRLEP